MMIFKGGILGSMQFFWCGPYLNGTTVPFDILRGDFFADFAVWGVTSKKLSLKDLHINIV